MRGVGTRTHNWWFRVSLASRPRSNIPFGNDSEDVENMKYYGIYRDDGCVIFDGEKSKREINEWLLTFQKKVDKITESNCPQFTAEVWKIEEDTEVKNDNLTLVDDKYFPYLDMEMYWNRRGELKFQVH